MNRNTWVNVVSDYLQGVYLCEYAFSFFKVFFFSSFFFWLLSLGIDLNEMKNACCIFWGMLMSLTNEYESRDTQFACRRLAFYLCKITLHLAIYLISPLLKKYNLLCTHREIFYPLSEILQRELNFERLIRTCYTNEFLTTYTCVHII